jgi:SAM-dependent methyltransferase
MQAGALTPYEQALNLGRPLRVRHLDGRYSVLDVPRWLAPADNADLTVVQRCVGPVLDIGCGPGRMLAALAKQQLPALGIDIAEQALSLAGQRGVRAIHADALTTTIDSGRWRTVLLLDGNIGIGGDPLRLLRRMTILMHPRGQVIVEAHPRARTDRRGPARFARGRTPIGPHFPWAEVGAEALDDYTRRAGLELDERWSHCGRQFARFTGSAR